MGEFAELNLYRFNYNNAVNFIDPDGLWGVQIGGINFGYGDPTYVFDGVDWDGYWGDVGDTLAGELKGAGSELSFGLYTPCYTSDLQRQGGYVGVGLAMAGETLGGLGLAGKAVKGAKTGLEGATEFSHFIPDRYLKKTGSKFIRDTFGKSRLNGNYVSPKWHYHTDPKSWPSFMKGYEAEAMWGRKWPAPFAQLGRIPALPAGAAAAAAGGYGATSGSGQPCQ